MSTDTVMSFSAMLREALGSALAPGASRFLDMFAEDGVMEFPFAPPGVAKRLEGRPALAAHLASLEGLASFNRMALRSCHRALDAEVFVLEFDGFGTGAATGRPFEQSYVSVITLRDGRIAQYRDYWNPLVVIEALGGDAVRASFAKDHADV